MLKGEDFFVSDFIEVAESMKVDLRELNSTLTDEIYSEIFKRYFSGNKINFSDHVPMCQYLKDETYGVHLPNGSANKKIILDFLENIDQKVYFSFDMYYSKRLFEFKKIKELSNVLDNSYNFDFLIVGESYNFLLYWSTDEVLIGMGEAKEWVKLIETGWRY